MSWSLERIGTREAVTAAITVDFDKAAASYAGKEEEKDVLACKERALTALADMDNTPTMNGVRVTASGSRSTWGQNMRVEIVRVELQLGLPAAA